MRIAAAVLAGGQSSRMGRDKASLPSFEDAKTTMLLRTVRLAAAVFAPVIVVGRTKPEDWPPQESSPIFVPDEEPNEGPAAGLASLFRFLRRHETSAPTAVAVLACDLPMLNPAAIRWLYDTTQQGVERHGLVARNGDQIEPLFAVYTADCLPLLEDHLAKGRRSLQKLIEAGEFTVVEVPPEISDRLVNVNTIEDLARVQHIMKSGGKP